jgi:hypothetical protein
VIEKLKPINQFINSLGRKKFQQYASIYLGCVLAIVGLILYLNYKKISGPKGLKKKIVFLNQQREEVQEILTTDEEVNHQKTIVDRTLKQRSFRLKHYFEHIINKLNLKKNLQKHTALVSNLEHLRSQGYSEVRVEASLTNLNTKQLVELLDEIEKTDIIHTKYLEVTRPGKTQVIDVMLTIATLQLDKNETAG